MQPGRVGLGVEVDERPAAAQVGESHRLAVLVVKREVGCGPAGVDHELLLRSEQAGGVLLEHQRPHLVVDLELLEVAQPAVRRDHRVVRAEQDLVLEQRVRVLDQLGREVLRRPARQVDVDLRLVHGDRERLVLPGERGVRQHDRHLREVGGHVVHVDRVASTSAAARRRPARPSRSRCGRCGRARAGRPRRSPRRAGRPSRSFGKNSWMLGWNLKPRTPCSSISRCARSAASGRGGSTLANGIITSALAAATSATSSFATGGAAAARLVVDGEDHARHPALAVVGGHVRRRSAVSTLPRK